MSNPSPPTLPVWALVTTIGLCVAFGGDQISRKVALTSFSPLESGAWAYALSAMLLWVYAYVRKVPWKPPSKRIALWHGLSALLFLLVNTLGLLGLQFTSAGRATIFIATYPFFVTIFAWLTVQREHLSIQKILGLCVACAGVILVLTQRVHSGGSHFVGDALVMLSSVLLAVMILHLRRVSHVVHPLQATLWQITLSVPAFIGSAFYFEKPSLWTHSAQSWLAILYQVFVINTLGFVVRAELIRRYGASTIAVFFFLTPVIGIVLSGLLLNEQIGLRTVVGGLIVGMGILLVQYSSRVRKGST